jgi:hypothetical protein
MNPSATTPSVSNAVSSVEPASETVYGSAVQTTAAKPATQATRYLRRTQGPAGTKGLPKMPKIGLPEKVYLRAHDEAKARGDDLTVEAAKVGQYVSLALRDPDASWSKKLKYFRHALKRHAQPPEHADAITKEWFAQLARHVKAYVGAEAVRLATEENERYRTRVDMGQGIDGIAEDAEEFFDNVCPHCDTCPPVYNPEDWERLKVIRDRWI